MSADAAQLERLARVEAELEAARIMGNYYLSVDDGYDLDALSALFAPGAECRTSLAPEISDVPSFLAFQAGAQDIVEWAFHVFSRMDFRYDAATDTSRGVWNLLGLHTMKDGDTRVPVIYTGRYDVTFTRTDDGWKISRLLTDIHQISQFDRGWVEQPFYLPSALQG